MNISRKVRQWQAAGLIGEATAARIEAFERSGERPIVLYTVGGLGALTIGIGIISVVAANWEGLGSSVKLAVDLVLAVILAAATLTASRFHEGHEADALIARRFEAPPYASPWMLQEAPMK